jgi:predicted small secreted protein
MESHMKACMATSFAACTALLSGCNAIAGAGKDIERGCEKVQEAAHKARIGIQTQWNGRSFD